MRARDVDALMWRRDAGTRRVDLWEGVTHQSRLEHAHLLRNRFLLPVSATETPSIGHHHRRRLERAHASLRVVTLRRCDSLATPEYDAEQQQRQHERERAANEDAS